MALSFAGARVFDKRDELPPFFDDTGQHKNLAALRAFQITEPPGVARIARVVRPRKNISIDDDLISVAKFPVRGDERGGLGREFRRPRLQRRRKRWRNVAPFSSGSRCAASAQVASQQPRSGSLEM